jgi:hypothetical protein
MEKSIGNLVAFPAEASGDILTEVLREGARGCAGARPRCGSADGYA